MFICKCGREKKKKTSLTCRHCASTHHGMSETRFYRAWTSMHRRCDNKTQDSYPLYGGRGIFVCERWSKFENFFEDMKIGYMEHLTLDRIDSNGNYFPENCRWITKKEQARNRRTNKILTFKGQSKTLAEWAEITGFGYDIIKLRLRRGWSVNDALTEGRRINQYA